MAARTAKSTVSRIDGQSQRRFRVTNWPLFLGVLIVILVIIAAVQGPNIAPKDPLQQNTMIRYREEWFPAPLSAFEVPEYPLGTDQFGRDLLSMLLWGIRPTMILVGIVAVSRLAVGISIGLVSGWNAGRLGRLFDTLISSALAVPVLIIALGAIAMFGGGDTILAFIVGLTITGWADTARLVREQTRQIKGQLFVEAATSMGATDLHILFKHVLKHVMPMGWMLFSFEVSSTLLVTAGLGFLGYFIGGDAFVITSDTTLTRASGTPELGQMLATSWISLTEPWGLFASGLAVLMIVLGFSLLGEGLRKNLQVEGRRTIQDRFNDRFGLWIDQHISYPVGRFARTTVGRVILWGIPVLLVGYFSYTTFFLEPVVEPINIALPVPGGHLWGAERHDPYGTMFTEARGPEQGEIEWRFRDPAGFTGGVVVASDGTLYLTSNAGRLYAVNPNGDLEWFQDLPAVPIGTPALNAEGDIFVTDDDGALNAFSPAGDLLWRFTLGFTRNSTAGPIVTPDGMVIYPAGSLVVAVSPEGELVWQGQADFDLRPTAPRLSPDGRYVFLDDVAIATADGSKVELTAVEDAAEGTNTGFSRTFYVVDPGGRIYLVSRNVAAEWQGDGEVVQRITWDPSLTVWGDPADEGVTPNQVVWRLFTASSRFDTIVQWIDQDGVTLGNVQYTHRPTWVMGMDIDSTIYTCGFDREENNLTKCVSWSMGMADPNWTLEMEFPQRPMGGAVIDGRMYVVTNGNNSGHLYAIGAFAGTPQLFEAPPASVAASDTGAQQSNGGEEDGAPTAEETNATQSLNDFFNDSYIALLVRNPELVTEIGLSESFGMDNSLLLDVSPAYREQTTALYEATLEELQAWKSEDLTPEEEIAVAIYEWYLEDEILAGHFMYYDFPFNQIFGEHNNWLNLMLDTHPIDSIANVRAYNTRVAAFTTKATQWVEWLEAQESAGIIPPRFVIQHVLDQMGPVIEGAPEDHILYTNLADKVNQLGSLTDVQKSRLIGEAATAVQRGVFPGYRRLIQYFEELLDAAPTDEVSIANQPGGAEYYKYILRHHTTTDLTADEIHEIGLSEVERIQAEMEVLFSEHGITGETLEGKLNQVAVQRGFINGQAEIVAVYEDLLDEASENLSDYFDVTPEAELVVVPFSSPTGAGAFYVHPPVDGSRPGQFYVNLGGGPVPYYTMPTLAYHEGIPGHHFQIAIQQELEGLPYFRNGVGFTAYAEGWALYAEYLALEAGFYDDDPFGNLGRLQGELFRAARLVVDTGLHSKGWSREEAINYMVETTGYSRAGMTAEVERYIVWPGQATAYKIGMLKIQELRQLAEDALGNSFDLKAFHTVVLENGSVPLEVLDMIIDQWIASVIGGG